MLSRKQPRTFKRARQEGTSPELDDNGPGLLDLGHDGTALRVGAGRARQVPVAEASPLLGEAPAAEPVPQRDVTGPARAVAHARAHSAGGVADVRCGKCAARDE